MFLPIQAKAAYSARIARQWFSEKKTGSLFWVLLMAIFFPSSVCPASCLPSLFARISVLYHVSMVTSLPGWPHLSTCEPWVIAMASRFPLSYYFLGCHGVTSLITPPDFLLKLGPGQTSGQMHCSYLQAFSPAKVCVAVPLLVRSPQSSLGRIAFPLLLQVTAETKCSVCNMKRFAVAKTIVRPCSFLLHHARDCGRTSNCWHSSWAPHRFGHPFCLHYHSVTIDVVA